MPKVKCYSAPWLSRNAHGNQLFEPSPDTARSGASDSPYAAKKATQGPRRTIARRGTEVFVAVGKQLRWGDLAYIKEEWANNQLKGRHGSRSRVKTEDSLEIDDIPDIKAAGGLRTIKVPVADDIRQLVISPDSNLLAILTTHTIHICVIPDSSHLTSQDSAPLKPKIFTLGPTTHVTSRSPVMSAVWHPLGVNGSCIVTVTADAIVRIWELSTTDRWSFDTPTSSIDLKKLADGTTLEQDFSASTVNTSKAFSPDSFEMEVASANFASKGSGGWNSMTLWIAMREGDVYALCPLLPQRWAPPPTLIPSLSVSIVATVASIEDDSSVSDENKLLAQQQLQWMSDLDSQEPQIIESTVLGDPPFEVYTRPSRPSVTPRLQGPFELIADPDTGDDLDTSITDIMIIGKKTETGDLMMGEEEDLETDTGDQEGLSLAVICLISTSGQVRIYLDMEGVQAQWLPPKTKSKVRKTFDEVDLPSLLAFQAIDTMTPVEVTEESWPVFSSDALSRYNFFVTHHAGIAFISLAPWVFRLEGELEGNFEAGTDFRIGLLANSQSNRERVYAQPTADVAMPLAGCIVLRDPDVGYFLLSATPYEPIAITFDSLDLDVAPASHEASLDDEHEASMAPLEFYEPRPVYSPPHVFEQESSLPLLLERLRTSRHKTIVTQEVRLSPLTLQIFTDAHKVLSDETYKLEISAAEIFRRCELLQKELKQQVGKANEVKDKIGTIHGVDREDESDNAMYERRIAAARERQDSIAKRVENMRKVVSKATMRELSNKERAFIHEVNMLNVSVSGDGQVASGDGREEGMQRQGHEQFLELWKRLEHVKMLRAELVADVEALNKKSEETTTVARADPRIPQDIRRSKMQQVQGLLSRETALLEAVTSRLERLQTTS